MASRDPTLPAFEGDLAAFPVTEVFGMASNLALTGRLELRRDGLGHAHAAECIQIHLRGGRLVGAQYAEEAGLLGELLVRRYGLAADDLGYALRVQRVWRQRGGYAPRLGVLLLGLGKLTSEVLGHALEHAWIGVVRRALDWRTGHFAFFQTEDQQVPLRARGVAVQRVTRPPELDAPEWVPPRFSVDPVLSLEETVLKSRQPDDPDSGRGRAPQRPAAGR